MPMDMCWKKMTSKMHQKTGKIPSLKNPVDTSENWKGTNPSPHTNPIFLQLATPPSTWCEVRWRNWSCVHFNKKRSTASMAHGMENHATYIFSVPKIDVKLLISWQFQSNFLHVLTSRPKQEIWSENQSFESSSAVFRSPSMRFELWQAIQTVEFRIIGWSKTPASRSTLTMSQNKMAVFGNCKSNKKLPPKKSNRTSNFRPLNTFIAVDVPDYCCDGASQDLRSPFTIQKKNA